MEKYYKVLELSPGASQDAVKKAYRKLAQVHHPDHGGDQEKFKEISEAYEVLSGKRKAANRQSQEPNVEDFNAHMRDIFERMSHDFGAGFRPKQRKPPQSDREVGLNIQLSIEDIKQGKAYSTSYNRAENCVTCNGVGGKSRISCNRCRGSGILTIEHRQGNIAFATQHPCNVCKGEGTSIQDPCGDCGSIGYKVVSRTINFKIEEIK